ncbi:uncharacterized protein BO95DRAFT_445009 [Aspergillus brunneoviolaceus CBS 621.78]|uniref:Uncharacterized protein n=1 Tax=Aspergillus brunneoviolaceus CBS 621.78 TaxID=1450534 RepID=A0ACD1G332_9EURO|nr:hypothetical protein BO95DRAFT_445009 [Aspergillus brunneoviolaceus CBS 621.78]RAH43625.1 hypothetical protein BO95DRAFT_445009 [Aspergillus brunneoviolaceus CBS 621.78]
MAMHATSRIDFVGIQHGAQYDRQHAGDDSRRQSPPTYCTQHYTVRFSAISCNPSSHAAFVHRQSQHSAPPCLLTAYTRLPAATRLCSRGDDFCPGKFLGDFVVNLWMCMEYALGPSLLGRLTAYWWGRSTQSLEGISLLAFLTTLASPNEKVHHGYTYEMSYEAVSEGPVLSHALPHQRLRHCPSIGSA